MNQDVTTPLPEDMIAEKALLSYAIYYNQSNQIVRYNPWLTPEMFKLHAHQEIWRAVKELVEQGAQSDGVAVMSHLGAEKMIRYGLNNTLADISDSGARGGDSNPSQFAKSIREQYQRREALRQISDLNAAFMSGAPTADALETASQVIFALQNQANGLKPLEIHTSKELMPAVIENVQMLCSRAGKLPSGLATGFTSLDAITGGLKPGTLNIVGGRPGMGKSALMANIAENVAIGYGDWSGYDQAPKPVIFVTLEMSETEITQRMTLSKSKINARYVKAEVTTKGGMERFSRSAEILATQNIRYLDAPRLTIATLATQLRRDFCKNPASLVVIDYLQLIAAESSKTQRYVAIGEITRGLKSLAKELQVPFIVGAQLGRAAEKTAVQLPKISDLRESGDIEQDADMVLMIHRPAYYADKQALGDLTNDDLYCDDMNGNRVESANLIIGKHRGGPCDTLLAGWEGAYTRFRSISSRIDY